LAPNSYAPRAGRWGRKRVLRKGKRGELFRRPILRGRKGGAASISRKGTGCYKGGRRKGVSRQGIEIKRTISSLWGETSITAARRSGATTKINTLGGGRKKKAFAGKRYRRKK